MKKNIQLSGIIIIDRHCQPQILEEERIKNSSPLTCRMSSKRYLSSSSNSMYGSILYSLIGPAGCCV